MEIGDLVEGFDKRWGDLEDKYEAMKAERNEARAEVVGLQREDHIKRQMVAKLADERDAARAESQKHYNWYLNSQANWYRESTRADDMEFLVRQAVERGIDDRWLTEAKDTLALHWR